MKHNLWIVFGVVSGLALTAATATAHHSFAAQYDANKRIEFEGTVTKMEWMSPHIYFYVNVEDENGRVTNYAVEGGAPTCETYRDRRRMSGRPPRQARPPGQPG